MKSALFFLVIIAAALVCTDANRCLLPKDVGGCARRFRGYYYDATSGFCKRFVFGTCGGNENKFRTQEQCEQACVAHRCQLPADFGFCRHSQSVYRYNPEARACQQFDYGGNGGNANRFDNLKDCERQCMLSDSPKTATETKEPTTLTRKMTTNHTENNKKTLPTIMSPGGRELTEQIEEIAETTIDLGTTTTFQLPTNGTQPPTRPPRPTTVDGCHSWPCHRPWLA